MNTDEIIAKVKGFLFNPVESFQGARADGTDILVWYLAALLLVNAVLTTIIAFTGIGAMSAFTGMMPGVMFPVAIFFASLIGGAILTAVFCLWVHIWVFVLGGRKGLLETAKAVIYGMTPSLLLGWVPFLGFFFLLWSIVLEIIGIRELQEMSSGRALLVMIIAVMIPLVLLIIVAMYFFVSAVSTSAVPYNGNLPILE
jgi:hypothetical protein